ncbi:MAG: hypothetical protein ABI729_07815 [Chitinophagales bacterium]
MVKPFLLAECNIEREVLIRMGFSFKHEIEKADGKSDVIIRSYRNYQNQIAIGLVDEDPHKNHPREYFEYKKELDRSYQMKFIQRPNSQHYLIEFYGEFEPWILQMNKFAKIDAGRYKVESIPRRLHEMNQLRKIPSHYLDFYWKIWEAYPEPFNKIKEWIDSVKSHNQ